MRIGFKLKLKYCQCTVPCTFFQFSPTLILKDISQYLCTDMIRKGYLYLQVSIITGHFNKWCQIKCCLITEGRRCGRLGLVLLLGDIHLYPKCFLRPHHIQFGRESPKRDCPVSYHTSSRTNNAQLIPHLLGNSFKQ